MGLKADSLRVKLIPSIPSIISDGSYLGRTPVGGRKDDVVAFHFFEGNVSVDGEAVKAGVTVAEHNSGELFYNLNHDQTAVWEKRKALRLSQEKPEALAPSTDDSSSVKKSIGDQGVFVNLHILNQGGNTAPPPRQRKAGA